MATHPNWEHIEERVHERAVLALLQRALDPATLEVFEGLDLCDSGLLGEAPEHDEQVRREGVGEAGGIEWVGLGWTWLLRGDVYLLAGLLLTRLELLLLHLLLLGQHLVGLLRGGTLCALFVLLACPGCCG